MTNTHARELDDFAAAARWCTSLVATIGDDQWDEPGLGAWDLRGLVGHTGRAFLTLETALDQPADEVTLPSPEDYFAAILSQQGVDDLVLERGIASGRDLGDDPASAFAAKCESALSRLSRLEEVSSSASVADAAIMTVGGGMRTGDYVRTRTFELVVHGSDIAAALGTDPQIPDSPLRDSLEIAVELAVRGGTGSRVLAALTGRGGLAGDFSVLG